MQEELGGGTPTTPSQPTHRELTPTDRAITEALKHIALSREDLISAGVSPDQIRLARAKAVERVRTRYAEIESQDPLSRIDFALKEAAETVEDQRIIDHGRQSLVHVRETLAEAVKHPEIYKKRYVWYRNSDGKAVQNIIIPILSGPYGDSESPSQELQERVLRNLGALREDQSLTDLTSQQFPQFDAKSDNPTPTGPLHEVHYGDHFITRLPTNIDGIEARVNISHHRYVFRDALTVSYALNAPQKIQSPVQSRI